MKRSSRVGAPGPLWFVTRLTNEPPKTGGYNRTAGKMIV